MCHNNARPLLLKVLGNQSAVAMFRSLLAAEEATQVGDATWRRLMLFDVRDPLRLHVVCLLDEFILIATEIASRH
jgi:hypothetical protein